MISRLPQPAWSKANFSTVTSPCLSAATVPSATFFGLAGSAKEWFSQTNFSPGLGLNRRQRRGVMLAVCLPARERMQHSHRPGESTSWTAFRDGRLVSGEITFVEDPIGKLEIKPLKDATDAQKKAFESWAHAPFEKLSEEK